jgi:hypothetical protein
MAEELADEGQGTPDPDNATDLPEGGEEASEEEIWAEIAAEEAGDSTEDLEPVGDELEEGEPAAAEAEQEQEEASQESNDSDPWAKAPGELLEQRNAMQKELERLQQADRSNRGRLSAMQHKINDLEKARSEPPAAEAADDKTTETSGYAESDQWKDFSEEYPEIAKPLQGVIDVLNNENASLRKQIADQGKTIEAVNQDRTRSELESNLAALEEKHADWREIADSDEFGPWLDKQPNYVRAAAARNASEIVDADEAADLIGRFKAFRSEQGTPAQSGSPQGENGTALSNRRQRQLRSSASARSRGPGAAAGAPPPDADEAQHWAYFAEQDKRQSAGA